jgi:hypothetical protein
MFQSAMHFNKAYRADVTSFSLKTQPLSLKVYAESFVDGAGAAFGVIRL